MLNLFVNLVDYDEGIGDRRKGRARQIECYLAELTEYYLLSIRNASVIRLNVQSRYLVW